jgi:hypothetical protein
MKKKKLFKITGIIFILFVAYIVVRFPSSYEGKVVDADTGESVEGVVVLLFWYHATLLHTHSKKYFDAVETLTDKNGTFKTKRRKINLNPFSGEDRPQIRIFKSGYKRIRLTWVLDVFRKEHKKWDSPLKKLIDFEGDLVVFKLKRLSTREERRKNSPSAEPWIPYEKRKLYMKEVNKERNYLGYDPLK